MNLENHVPGRETCERLKAAGFGQDTAFVWSAWSDHGMGSGVNECHELHWKVYPADGGAFAPRCAAPLLSELLEALREYTSLIHIDIFKSGCAVRDGKRRMVGTGGYAEGYVGYGDIAEAAAQLWLRVHNAEEKEG